MCLGEGGGQVVSAVQSCCMKYIVCDELFSYLPLHMNIKQVARKACFKF